MAGKAVSGYFSRVKGEFTGAGSGGFMSSGFGAGLVGGLGVGLGRNMGGPIGAIIGGALAGALIKDPTSRKIVMANTVMDTVAGLMLNMGAANGNSGSGGDI